MSTNKIVCSLFCAAALCSCTAAQQEEWFVTHNGNMPAETRIAQIDVGSSKDDVLGILGAPSSVAAFDDNTWIYMSSDIKKVAFFKPEEIDRNILKIRFNTNDEVKEVTRLTLADGTELTPDGDKTEIRGQRQGFFRKYFGGVGQYNPFATNNTANGI